MRDRSRRSRVHCCGAILLFITLLSTTGCQDKDTADALTQTDLARVKSELQSYYDKHPQCAPVLDHRGVAGDLSAARGDPAARALVEAGLIERTSRTEGEQVVRYRPKPKYRSSFVHDQSDWWLLCFASRKIGNVRVRETPISKSIYYDFALVDAPAWMRDPAIAKTFPRVVALLSVRHSDGPVTFDDREIDFDTIESTDVHAMVRINNAAFMTF